MRSSARAISPRRGSRCWWSPATPSPATVASGAYQSALRRLAPLSTVVARACPLFVPLAEEGWTEGEVPRLVAERYLGDLRRAGADTVLLGCTHYPLLAGVIAEVMGPGPALVDSAQAAAEGAASRGAEWRPGGPSAKFPRGAPRASRRAGETP